MEIPNEYNFIISEVVLKHIKYYKSLYNLVFLYKNELDNLIKNDEIKDHLNSNIDENIIKNILKKIEKYNLSIKYDSYEYKMPNSKKENELIKLLKLFKKLIGLNNILKSNMEIINNIDIFDQKTLMSDTTKNNIHKNKLHIIDIYNSYQSKIIPDTNNILNSIIVKIVSIIIPDSKKTDMDLNIDELTLAYSLIKSISNYTSKNIKILDLFCLFIQKIENIDGRIDDLITTIKENFKNFTIESDLKDNKIKINSNIAIDLKINNKPSKISKYVLIKENLNIVKNLNKFKYIKSYKTLNDLFNIYLESKVKITNKLNSANFTQIYNFAELYFKQYKKELVIVLIECEKDNINYNITNLLDRKLTVDKMSGINDIFIKKTNTIIEYPADNTAETYISNIQKIHIVNSPYSVDEKKNILSLSNDNYNAEIVLIHTNSNDKFDIFTNINKTIKLKDILFLFHNKPNYRIENYNNIIENNILNQIEKKNILEEYHKSINFDINTYSSANSIEIKNKIISDIKTKIKLEFNLKNKHIIIEQILDIIVDNIAKFIKNKNKIEYNSEIYLTYFSNVNSVINKFKKEVVDNYDNNFISNIGDIVENIQSKIIKIDENIIDKYYYSNMFK